jgi:hypothetical protein
MRLVRIIMVLVDFKGIEVLVVWVIVINGMSSFWRKEEL